MASKQDQYSLPRDKTESTRLESQHDLYVANTGYLLHPTIASSLPANASIAEVATGTGIWLRALAPDCPETYTFTGLDISPSQFPDPSTLDPRITLTTLNILDPIPSEYQSKFDVVHVRLLVCGLVGKDWETTAKHLFQLLKPGGWLQWHESVFVEYDIMQSVPGASTRAMNEVIAETMFSQNAIGRNRKEDVEGLRKLVEGAGFEGAWEEDVASDRDAGTRALATEIGLNAVKAFAGMFLKDGVTPGGWTMEKMDKTLEEAWEEARDGKVYFRWPMKIVVGRKP